MQSMRECVSEARVRNDMKLIVKQAVLFAPLHLVVSSSPTTPEAQQHSQPQSDFSMTHNLTKNGIDVRLLDKAKCEHMERSKVQKTVGEVCRLGWREWNN
ncbi:hypothetical protein NQZ68_001475 [Dissostichus eleginoides]|nr:hypothetical protein NQZ68_001475 [Dissostichus eleginoides]